MSLTPLQLNVVAGMLQNQGIAANVAYTASVTAYNSLPPISDLNSTINLGNGILSSNTITSLQTLSTNTCPALTNSYPANAVPINYNGYTGNLANIGNTYLGNGDLSKFAQYFTQAYGYVIQTNNILNSSINSETYLGPTYTNMDSVITGSITSVNLATRAFGEDLANLGNLIDLNDLGNLGSPAALANRLFTIAQMHVPVVVISFLAMGIPQDVVLSLGNPTSSFTDTIQKLMYKGMTQITDEALSQVLNIFGVKTVGIETMADLLNPVKLFPNSFQSLTAPTPDGSRAIYVNSGGDVNQALATQLPAYVLRSTA